MHSTYADNDFVSSRAEIDDDGKEIRGYEAVTGPNISRDKSVGLR